MAKTISVVSGGAAKSWQLENLGPKMVAHDFRPGFMIDLMQKDLRLVMQSGQEANCPLAASALVHQLFTFAQAHGHGRDGTQAIFAVMEACATAGLGLMAGPSRTARRKRGAMLVISLRCGEASEKGIKKLYKSKSAT